MGVRVKWNAKVQIKSTQLSPLVLRAPSLIPESKQVDIAWCDLGKSNLAVSSRLHVLHTHGNGFHGEFLQEFPGQKARFTSHLFLFVHLFGGGSFSFCLFVCLQMRETIVFVWLLVCCFVLFCFLSARDPQFLQPFQDDREQPDAGQNDTGQLLQHHTKHVPEN